MVGKLYEDEEKSKKQRREHARHVRALEASACVLLWEATLRAQSGRCVMVG